MTDESRASEGGAGAPPVPDQPNRAPDLTRVYDGAGVQVEWYASRCIHSANCVRALPLVFDPRRRPWVDASAANAQAIADAVLRCPTGALHFVRTDGGPQEHPESPTTSTPVRNGPLYVRGDVVVNAADGSTIRRDSRVALCRCPHSKKAPFCDNSCRLERWREPVNP